MKNNNDQDDDTITLHDLSTQQQRSDVFGMFFTSKSNFTRDGYHPSENDAVITRKKRTFKDARVEQLLRQISTQLFFAAKAAHAKPTEVQTMFIQNDMRSNLYIACNDPAVAQVIYKIINESTLETVLTSPCSYGGMKKEGRKRSPRYAGKIRSRVFAEGSARYKRYKSDDPTDHAYMQSLRQLLAARLKPTEIDMMNESSIVKSLLATSGVHIITKCPTTGANKGRHAEEWLNDISERIEGVDYKAMFGKKRPCITCSGRLLGSDIDHNPNPGFAFKTRFIHQPPEIAMRSLQIASTKHSHTTDNGGSGYGTDSDSSLFCSSDDEDSDSTANDLSESDGESSPDALRRLVFK